jgi:tRNA dimethylallyltransferase
MGPTASGKSSMALEIAEKFKGEIVTADSMQVYRGLDIGTAKPSAEEQQQIPHHLIDILDITEPVDVYSYVEAADQAIREIQSRNKLPIIAGGSGMYLRGLLYGLDPLPADAELRAHLDKLYDHEEGFEKLKEIMKERDPEDYQRWRKHRRKLIRALEVFELTGQSISRLQTVWEAKLRYPAIVWNLCWDRAELRKRIETRTAEMLDSGWIEEAKVMIAKGVLSSPTAHQVLGYRFIDEYLKGQYDYEKLQHKIAVSTWHLARRQMTWFNNKHPEAEKIQMPADIPNLSAKLKQQLQGVPSGARDSY